MLRLSGKFFLTMLMLVRQFCLRKKYIPAICGAWPVAMKKPHFQFKKNCNVKSILTENQVISQNIKRPNMGSQMSEMWTWKLITNLVPQGLPARFSMAAILEVDELLVIDFIEKIKNVSSPSFRICKNLLKMLNPKIVYKPLHFLEIGQNTVTHIKLSPYMTISFPEPAILRN